MTFRHRLATQQDIPAIIDLMKLSIEENMKTLLSCEEIEAAKETMGVDQTLIDDGTYFVIEVDTHERTLVGCGAGESGGPCMAETTPRVGMTLSVTLPGRRPGSGQCIRIRNGCVGVLGVYLSGWERKRPEQPVLRGLRWVQRLPVSRSIWPMVMQR